MRMDIDVTRLKDGNEFQRMCNDLIKRTITGLKPIEGAGGDDGIDSFTGYLNGELVVYQYKFLPGRLTSSRKKQILESFSTAKDKNKDLKKWTLLIPTDFTTTEQKWFENEIINKNNSIDIDYWGKQHLESEIIKNETVLERYFSASTIAAGKKAEKALSFLTDPPIKKLFRHTDEIKKVLKDNKHLGAKIRYDSEKNQTHVDFNPQYPVEFKVSFKFPKEKFGDIKTSDEFLKKLNDGIVHFSEEEVSKVEFKDKDMEGLIPKDGKVKMTIMPQYLMKKVPVILEVPNTAIFYDYLEIEPISNTDDSFVFKINNLPFEMQITMNKQTNIAKIDLKDNFSGKSIHYAKRFIEFVEATKKNKFLLIRDKKSGKPVLNGNVNIDDNIEIDKLSANLIKYLTIIEQYSGVSFTFPENVSEEEYNYMVLGAELLKNSKYFETIGNLKLSVKKEGVHKFIEDFESKGQINGITTKYTESKINIFGKVIDIGDTLFKFPPMKISNLEEIKTKLSENIDNVEIVLIPVNKNDKTEVMLVK